MKDIVGYLHEHGFPKAGWMKCFDEDIKEECMYIYICWNSSIFEEGDGFEIID